MRHDATKPATARPANATPRLAPKAGAPLCALAPDASVSHGALDPGVGASHGAHRRCGVWSLPVIAHSNAVVRAAVPPPASRASRSRSPSAACVASSAAGPHAADHVNAKPAAGTPARASAGTKPLSVQSQPGSSSVMSGAATGCFAIRADAIAASDPAKTNGADASMIDAQYTSASAPRSAAAAMIGGSPAGEFSAEKSTTAVSATAAKMVFLQRPSEGAAAPSGKVNTRPSSICSRALLGFLKSH